MPKVSSNQSKTQVNHNNGEPVAGTGLSTLTPREYEKGTARHSSFNGVDGQTNNEKGNRNKS